MVENNIDEHLIISYVFPPADDVSGIVQAKKILADKKLVDLVVSDSGNDLSFDFAELSKKYINEKIIIEMNNKPLNAPDTILFFIEKAMEELENRNNDYKLIYSICWRISNHLLALEYKFKHPEVFWSAEFSDPMLYDIFNKKRNSKLNDAEYINRLNGEISKLGDYPLLEIPSNIYFVVEYLTYLFADEIIFTNENQREIMLSQFPVDVYDKVMSKSRISPSPTLDEEYYHLNEVEADIDDNYINLAFFGTYYPKRHFESLFYAFDSLNHKFKDKIKLHMYVSDTRFLKELIKGLNIGENIIIHEIVDYLDFLNLTTKFDVLIATDLSTQGTFKINPYLPSKISDYMGSGKDIWMIYEKGSVMSKSDVKYKSDIQDYSTSREVLIKILEDYGYVDEDLSFDEYYFNKRLTLLNEYLHLRYSRMERIKAKNKTISKENSTLKKEINRLKSKNEKLKQKNDEFMSSNSWKITKPLRKLKNIKFW